MVVNAGPGESDLRLISPKTQTPQSQPIERKKRKKIYQNTHRGRVAYDIKKTLAQFLKPASPTPLNKMSGRWFHRDNERLIKVLWHCEVLQREGAYAYRCSTKGQRLIPLAHTVL